MKFNQLKIREELTPIFDTKINDRTKNYIAGLLESNCSFDEIKRRQKIIQSLMKNDQFLKNYNYNKIYFEATFKLTKCSVHDVFYHSTFLFKVTKKIKEEKSTTVNAAFYFLCELKDLLIQLKDIELLKEYMIPILKKINQIPLSVPIKQEKSKIKFVERVLQLDDSFWESLFTLESFISIAKSSKNKQFHLPSFDKNINLNEFYHPLLENPKKYNIRFTNGLNILTGANMGGKSTFLKALSICVFLGNHGFPIPAQNSSIPFFEYYSINFNTTDNYKIGSSHYMSELLSMKDFFLHNSKKFNVFGVFDELFNTTNPEESYTLIKRIFSTVNLYKNSFLLISTHLDVTELQSQKNIGFFYPLVKVNKDVGIATFTRRVS